ncbi:MAG: FAD-dependent thymidylate synthase [Planctomycetes bacterium]|nr:FAD-dependent thymidylate synthase [Planctomycetota bacterium]
MKMSIQPSVSLLWFTGKGTNDETYGAARLLAYTKNTRLQMTPDGYDRFENLPLADLERELQYMSNTIPSSWEFVDVIFSINNVSRACAQQITRTRTASFAMQSQRVTDMSQVTCHIPDSVKDKETYNDVLQAALTEYDFAVSTGESLEDARGLLPINVHCNLVAKYNLRSLVDLLRARDSMRVQGEYQMVARQMREAVFAVWPWVVPFFDPKDKKAIALIEEVAALMEDKHLKMQLAKAADLLKK